MAENRFQGSSDISRQYTRTTSNGVSATGHDDQLLTRTTNCCTDSRQGKEAGSRKVYLTDNLELLHLQSVLIFSILNHHCSF